MDCAAELLKGDYDCLNRGQATAAGAAPPGASEKIRVLFLIDEFDGAEGGTEQHLLFLLKELPRDRFDLQFGVLGAIRRFGPGDFPIRPVMLRESDRAGPTGALGRLRRLVRLIEAGQADVVHAFCRRSELYAILATRWAGRGRVLGVRRNIGYWHSGFSRWTARIVALGGAAYAANCHAAREFAAGVEWIPRRRVSVIENPLSTRRLQEGLANVAPRSSLGILDGEQVVGMVATVRPIKDYATFLRSARLVLDKHPNTRFLAIGDQEVEYAREMRRLGQDLGIDGRVSWVGPLANPISALPRVDVAVLSSRSEAFSNALLEYAAAGVAAVATDVGGSREIVQDAVTGFLVPPRSPELLADRVCRLLENPALRRQIGQHALSRARELWSEDKILQQYSLFYERLAQK